MFDSGFFSYVNKFKTLWFSDRVCLYNRLPFLKKLWLKSDLRYLEDNNVTNYLISGDRDEWGVDVHKQSDLVNIHKLISRKRPINIIEFGTGFSTLVIAHALKQNNDKYGVKGVLHVVEANKKWAENVRNKFEKLEDLKEYVNIKVYTPQMVMLPDLQICHVSSELPDVRPDFIYLDGPDLKDVEGEVNGLTPSGLSFVRSADILLYEWSLYPGFTMLVDGRFNNVEFFKTQSEEKIQDKT